MITEDPSSWILAYLVRTMGPGFIRSGLFNSDCSNRMQGSTRMHSQISHICETQQCLVLYTMDHGGYLLDKRQMGAVCINGLRTFLSERSGKSVKEWIQVRDDTCKSN